MAGQGAAATDRGVDVSGSRTPKLVFTTALGSKMDAANVRRDLRRASALVPGLDPLEGTPRELRHSFVSVLSDAGVPVEQISQLVGHSGTTVTELVHRHQLRASDRCDSDGLALQSARRKRVAVRRITQFVTQQRWCEAHDGRDSLIWLGGA